MPLFLIQYTAAGCLRCGILEAGTEEEAAARLRQIEPNVVKVQEVRWLTGKEHEVA